MAFQVVTTPTPPDAWLIVFSHPDGNGDFCVIITGPDDPQVEYWEKYEAEEELDPESDDPAPVMRVMKDEPTLQVNVGEIWITNPVHLNARDNWFRRFAHVLDGHLVDPLPTRVFTVPVGTRIEPDQSNPRPRRVFCPWDRAKPWPVCADCGQSMTCRGFLDFRDRSAAGCPKAWFVLHACDECQIYDSYSFDWVNPDADLQLIDDFQQTDIPIATSWDTIDFPRPCLYPDEISDDRLFLKEEGIYYNFSCFADKIGGYPCWVQNEYNGCDSEGNPMRFIGQLISADENMVVYVFYSAETGETDIDLQTL